KTSTEDLHISYETNSENWGGGASYQGSSFNVIPDFNTPITASNSGPRRLQIEIINPGWRFYSTIMKNWKVHIKTALDFA
ncbi:MAG: hypothetical protein EBX50_20865, partial [Chitinophagia bacterium]|nr:hypothetical protein [Chitinophagia bacterium]